MTLVDNGRGGFVDERQPPLLTVFAADTHRRVLSVEEQRKRVARHLEDGPGLEGVLLDLLGEACGNARRHALDETGLPQSGVPKGCSYSWDEIMTRPIEWSDAS